MSMSSSMLCNRRELSSSWRQFQILCPSVRFPSRSIIPAAGNNYRMEAFHKVKSLLGGCYFGKFNFDHFSSVLRRTRYFPSSIFPDALRMSDRNSTCMWMRALLSQLSLSEENPQRRKYLISHLSPQRGSSNRVLLNSTITSNWSHFSQRYLSQLGVIHCSYFLYDSCNSCSEIPISRIM